MFFFIFTTKQYHYFTAFSPFTLVSDEPEVFLPKYSQTATFHAAHIQRVVMVHIGVIAAISIKAEVNRKVLQPPGIRTSDKHQVAHLYGDTNCISLLLVTRFYTPS